MSHCASRFLPTELLIGVPEIDAEHEALFARLASLKAFCLENKQLPMAQADGLLTAMREHYLTEERLASGKMMDFSEHARQHQVVLLAVTKTLNEVVEGRANVFSLLRYLEYWFERHIAEEDMLLGLRLHSSSRYAGDDRLPGEVRRYSDVIACFFDPEH